MNVFMQGKAFEIFKLFEKQINNICCYNYFFYWEYEDYNPLYLICGLFKIIDNYWGYYKDIFTGNFYKYLLVIIQAWNLTWALFINKVYGTYTNIVDVN